jgi:hypothetical protein
MDARPLHGAWARQLLARWHQLNDDRLGGVLREPVFAIDTETTTRLGRWQPETRTIAIAERHILQDDWQAVLDTLAHEMAHQYAHEVIEGRQPTERPHGDAFGYACARLGVRRSGEGGLRASAADEKVMDRVRKLFALAESSNAHEAELAMTRANELLLRHNVTLAPAQRDYSTRVIGRAVQRLSLAEKLVASILGEHFFVTCIWIWTYDAGRDREVRQLELLGTASNLEMAAWVHDFLHASVERLWRGAQRERGLKGAADKRAFAAGLLTGFRDRLDRERQSHRERGLVWVGDGDLDAFVRDRHPRLRSLGSVGVRRGRAHALGRSEGENLRLHRPVDRGPSGGGRRRLTRD